jgi:hypothetical protein
LHRVTEPTGEVPRISCAINSDLIGEGFAGRFVPWDDALDGWAGLIRYGRSGVEPPSVDSTARCNVDA